MSCRPPLRLLSFAILFVPFALGLAAPARAEGPTYELKKTEPKVAVGAKSIASLTIAARNGWHVNGEAPISISLVAPAGLTLTKTKLLRADLAESTQEAARFEIPFEAIDVGTKILTAEARFVMCQESACKPVKEILSFNIEVSAAPAAAPKAKAAGKKKRA
ncbi:MAG TPA: hypothetical protein VH374_24265 [Polyangia bacterium]|jgi:hypothetical protein|nr:hypothetical protein [Polyangia bacterium]